MKQEALLPVTTFYAQAEDFVSQSKSKYVQRGMDFSKGIRPEPFETTRCNVPLPVLRSIRMKDTFSMYKLYCAYWWEGAFYEIIWHSLCDTAHCFLAWHTFVGQLEMRALDRLQQLDRHDGKVPRSFRATPAIGL